MIKNLHVNGFLPFNLRASWMEKVEQAVEEAGHVEEELEDAENEIGRALGPPEQGLKPELEGVYSSGTSPIDEKPKATPPKTYHPLSLEVLLLLMPAAVFGTLARLGIDALVSYPGESIFPLAYVQGVGCLIMGFCLQLKGSISDL